MSYSILVTCHGTIIINGNERPSTIALPLDRTVRRRKIVCAAVILDFRKFVLVGPNRPVESQRGAQKEHSRGTPPLAVQWRPIL
jgi:hypothetical protein